MPATAYPAPPHRDQSRAADIVEDVAFIAILVSAVALVAAIIILAFAL
jgi:hypothetical protein